MVRETSADPWRCIEDRTNIERWRKIDGDESYEHMLVFAQKNVLPLTTLHILDMIKKPIEF